MKFPLFHLRKLLLINLIQRKKRKLKKWQIVSQLCWKNSTLFFSDSSEETRQVVENRLEFLKDQFERFSNLINPFHVQPGLLLDIDISSIKKKKTTMMNMANVINEFLHSISKGYSDIRFADLSKSRSFERNDINQEFVSAGE